jgi:phosphatidyl-myo-inositol alpha-mannosyltransferase
MRIGLFCPYNIEVSGGVRDHVLEEAAELRARGHYVVIVTPRPRKYSGTHLEHVVFVGTSARIRAQASTPDVSSLVNSEDLERLFAEQKLDIVHVHEPTVPFLARQFMSIAPCPVVATLHAALPDTVMGKTLGSIKPYFRSIISHVDAFTRVSSAAGEYLEEEIEHIHSRFIPNGVKTSLFSAAKKRKPATVLYVGRFEKRKGVIYLLDAFKELKRFVPDAQLELIGGGHDLDKLKKYSLDNAIQDVHFLGKLPDAEKLKHLSSATVFASPALYGESFGIVLLEAMASGAPIVAGDNPGYRTVLKERGIMSLVDPRDSVEFARKMQLFIEDKEVADMWRDWAKKYVTQFDYKRIVSQYEQLFNSLVK